MDDKGSKGKHSKSVEGFEGNICKIIRKNYQKKYCHSYRKIEITLSSESERIDH